MTSIRDALKYQLTSLSSLLQQLDEHAYNYPSHWLSEATIGQHSRHVIELVQCLVEGYNEGEVNYDSRRRDQEIETNKEFAIACIHTLLPALDKADKKLLLIGSFDIDEQTPLTFDSTYYRELAYNVEHAVHHMALIKVGLKELTFENVSEDFGVAYATVQYRKLCAQ